MATAGTAMPAALDPYDTETEPDTESVCSSPEEAGPGDAPALTEEEQFQAVVKNARAEALRLMAARLQATRGK